MTIPIGTKTFEELTEVLSSTALQCFSAGNQYPIFRIDARELLNPRRFDLAIKIRFYKALIERRETKFGQDLYAAHLAVWNGFFEAAPAKFGPDAYIESFKKLIENFEGFETHKLLLPVDQKFTLIDGAHRASIAALNHTEISVVQCPDQGNSYDYRFFQSRCEGLSPELSTLLLDQMAYSYCLFKESTRFICLMPATKDQHHAKIEVRIREECEIVYHKRIKLPRELFDLLVLHLYWDDPTGWIGTISDNFRGARDKAGRCFSPEHEVSVFFVDGLSDKQAVSLKAEIRALYELDKDACHINDTFRETMTVAGLLLNSDWSVLSKLKFGASTPNFERYFRVLDKFALEQNVDRNDFCVGGSALFPLLGHRDCNDLDLLLGQNISGIKLPEGIGDHSNQANFYPAPLSEIIYDPGLHFSFLGIKFVRPEVILKFKRTRNEIPKDLRDSLALLEAFPNLENTNRISLSEEKILDTAHSSLERTIREQQRTIDKYEDTINNWYIPELKRLERTISSSQEATNEHKKHLEALRQQISFLEQMVEVRARPGAE